MRIVANGMVISTLINSAVKLGVRVAVTSTQLNPNTKYCLTPDQAENFSTAVTALNQLSWVGRLAPKGTVSPTIFIAQMTGYMVIMQQITQTMILNDILGQCR